VGRLHDQRRVNVVASAVAPVASVPITTPRLGSDADD
jgi:hypothetical protein